MSDNQEPFAESDAGSKRVRVAFTMRPEDHAELKRLAGDDTVAGYIRKAVATHRYIADAVERGAKVLVEVDGLQREVVFR